MDYVFVYKNMLGLWGSATNLEFIAKHPHCRAIPKDRLKVDVSEFVKLINSKEFINEDVHQVMLEYEIY